MSLTFKKGFVPSAATDGDQLDIDLIPLMSVLVILLPFLLSMAAFTHLSVIDFSVPPNVGAGLDQSAGKPVLKITVVVAPTFIAVTQGADMLDSLPRIGNDDNWKELRARLAARRAASDVPGEAVVAVNDRIPMQRVVHAMDACREAGFEKIGLSSAADTPAGAP